MTYLEIKNYLETFDSIVIYRHSDPDYDAIGSQLGLQYLLQANYPEKKVYTYGIDNINNEAYVPKMDNPDEEIIRNSCTVLLDCSTNKRADDQSFLLGKGIVKFDHHLNSEVVSDYMYVRSSANSTCLIITEFARETGLQMNQKAAQYLFTGILTDTCRLSIGSVDAHTFEILAYLVSFGVDITNANRQAFDLDKETFKSKVYFENKIVYKEDVAYFFGTLEDEKKFNMLPGEVKDHVSIMANIIGINRYAVFAQVDEETWTASLRSHDHSVVHIANKYGGGGHALACGIPAMTYQQCLDAIEEMVQA